MAENHDCAICYVTDPDFLVPTLVSAFSAKRWMKSSTADIFIFTLRVPDETLSEVKKICAPAGITVTTMDPEKISGFDPSRYARTHVPTSALGRFFLADYLPSRYQRIIYLDGDTWPVADISELIDYRPPEGKVIAAEDALYFFHSNAGSMGANAREYLKGLQIDGEKGYFNSGVLLATVTTWRHIMSDALAYFLANIEKCRYHDQSALNAVAKGRRVRLSPKWNFVSPYRHWGVEAMVRPHIYHFVGAAKPWMGKCEPWSTIYDMYMADFRKFEYLWKQRRMSPEELAN